MLVDDVAAVASEVVDSAKHRAADIAAEAAMVAHDAVDAVRATVAEASLANEVIADRVKESTGVRRINQPEPEAIDLLDSAGSPILKRAVPVVGVAVAALIVWRLLRRRR